ncbi:hypothetical protein CUMW_287440, partial [Citrus unshiu]
YEGWWEGHHLLQGLEAHLLLLLLIVEERSDCAIPWPREFRTRQSPLGKGHQIFTFPYPYLLKLAEIISEQLQTSRDLRDGGRLPTSRDSSVAGVPSAAAAALDALFHRQSPYIIAMADLQPLKARWQSNLRKGNKGTAAVDFYLSQGAEAER